MGFFLELPARRPSSKGDFGNGSGLSSLGEGGSASFGDVGGDVESAGECVLSFISSDEHRETGESVLEESSFCRFEAGPSSLSLPLVSTTFLASGNMVIVSGFSWRRPLGP